MRPLKSILIIEDDSAIRESLKIALELGGGYSVLSAENGQSALNQLQWIKDLPGLILLDLMMPVMNGVTFLKTIRTDKYRNLSRIPVIVLTAARDVDLDGMSVNEILQKPVDLVVLFDAVKKYCG